METFFLLIKREYWENRSLIIFPVVLCITLVCLSITGMHNSKALVNLANQASYPINCFLSIFFILSATIVMSIKGFFYTLGALFNDRKDGSILFWQSLPISNFTIVISKFATAVTAIIAPLFITLISCFLTYILSKTANNKLDLNLLLQIQLLALVSMMPILAWGLFISAYVPKNPFIIGVLLPLLIYIMLSIFGISGPINKAFTFVISPIFDWIALIAEAKYNQHSIISCLGYLLATALLLGATIFKKRERI